MSDLSAFSPAGATATLAVTGTTGRVALTAKPATAEITIIVQNIDTQIAFIQLGSSTVEATTTGMPIQPGSGVVLSTNYTQNTHLAAITATGTTTLYITSGTGIPYGFGGAAISGGAGGEDVNIVGPLGAATGQAAGVAVSQVDELAIPSTSVTSATTIFTQDMIGYESISVQVTAAGTACTITYETSDDNTNWVSATGAISTQAGTTALITTSTAVGLRVFPKYGRYFRARVSTYGSATVTVVGNLHKNPQPLTNRITVDGNTVAGSTSGSTSGFIPYIRSANSNPAAASNNINIQPLATTLGVSVVRPYGIPEADWQYAAASGGIVDTADNVLVAAGAAGVRNYLTRIDLINTDATVGTEVVVKDGSTVIWRTFVPASTAAVTQPMPVCFTFPSPLKGTAATALNVACITTSSQTYVNAGGYQAP